jgi:hypothetical protein
MVEEFESYAVRGEHVQNEMALFAPAMRSISVKRISRRGELQSFPYQFAEKSIAKHQSY